VNEAFEFELSNATIDFTKFACMNLKR